MWICISMCLLICECLMSHIPYLVSAPIFVSMRRGFVSDLCSHNLQSMIWLCLIDNSNWWLAVPCLPRESLAILKWYWAVLVWEYPNKYSKKRSKSFGGESVSASVYVVCVCVCVYYVLCVCMYCIFVLYILYVWHVSVLHIVLYGLCVWYVGM